MKVKREVLTSHFEVKQLLLFVPEFRTDEVKESVDVIPCRAERSKKTAIVLFFLGHSFPEMLETRAQQIWLVLRASLAVFMYGKKTESARAGSVSVDIVRSFDHEQ